MVSPKHTASRIKTLKTCLPWPCFPLARPRACQCAATSRPLIEPLERSWKPSLCETGVLLLAKISDETLANLLDRVLRSSSTATMTSGALSSEAWLQVSSVGGGEHLAPLRIEALYGFLKDWAHIGLVGVLVVGVGGGHVEVCRTPVSGFPGRLKTREISRTSRALGQDMRVERLAPSRAQATLWSDVGYL